MHTRAPSNNPQGNRRDRDAAGLPGATPARAKTTDLIDVKSTLASNAATAAPTGHNRVASTMTAESIARLTKKNENRQKAAEDAKHLEAQKTKAEEFYVAIHNHFVKVKETGTIANLQRKGHIEEANKYFVDKLPLADHNKDQEENTRKAAVLLIEMYGIYETQAEFKTELQTLHTQLIDEKSTLAQIENKLIQNLLSWKQKHKDTPALIWLTSIKTAIHTYQQNVRLRDEKSRVPAPLPTQTTSPNVQPLVAIVDPNLQTPKPMSGDNPALVDDKFRPVPANTPHNEKLKKHLDTIQTHWNLARAHQSDSKQTASDIENAIAEFKKCSDTEFHGEKNTDPKIKQAKAPYMLCMLINLADMMFLYLKFENNGKLNQTAAKLKKDLISHEELNYPQNISAIRKSLQTAEDTYALTESSPFKWLSDLKELVKNYTVDNIAPAPTPTAAADHKKTPPVTKFFSPTQPVATAAAPKTTPTVTAPHSDTKNASRTPQLDAYLEKLAARLKTVDKFEKYTPTSSLLGDDSTKKQKKEINAALTELTAAYPAFESKAEAFPIKTQLIFTNIIAMLIAYESTKKYDEDRELARQALAGDLRSLKNDISIIANLDVMLAKIVNMHESTYATSKSVDKGEAVASWLATLWLTFHNIRLKQHQQYDDKQTTPRTLPANVLPDDKLAASGTAIQADWKKVVAAIQSKSSDSSIKSIINTAMVNFEKVFPLTIDDETKIEPNAQGVMCMLMNLTDMFIRYQKCKTGEDKFRDHYTRELIALKNQLEICSTTTHPDNLNNAVDYIQNALNGCIVFKRTQDKSKVSSVEEWLIKLRNCVAPYAGLLAENATATAVATPITTTVRLTH